MWWDSAIASMSHIFPRKKKKCDYNKVIMQGE